MSGGQVRLVALTKRFGDFAAVDGIDLDIPAGEFFSLLGPSGCGKTTTLRIIGGFEQPTAGQVLLDGRDMAGTSPSKRPVNTVFQSYALFPHMKVRDNVAFGLRRSKIARKDLKHRVAEALEMVQLTRFADRKPGQLSGGQQQRVALARALVLKPAVLLLDEPLGALDAKLRRQLQIELKALQEQVGITFVYVTHDQEEALTMSDRVAVMNGGRVEQVGPPREVYEEPTTAYVADFLGVSNLMEAHVTPIAGGTSVELADGITVEARQGDRSVRGPATVVIRPERIVVEASGAIGPNRVRGMVLRSVYLGAGQQVAIDLASGQRVMALMTGQGDAPPAELAPGTPVTCHLPPSALRVLSASPPPGDPASRVEPDTAAGT